MNSAIEIHDSHLDSISEHHGNIVMKLRPAYIHKSDDVPGVDPGSGWVQEAVIKFRRGIVEGTLTKQCLDISDGILEIDEVISDNIIPLPLDRAGSVRLTLVATAGETVVVIHSEHILVRLEGNLAMLRISQAEAF